MTFNYSKYITLIANKIDYYGGYINYHQNVDGQIDSLTRLTTYNKIIIPLKAIVAPYSNTLIDGDNIMKGDKQVFIKSTIGAPNLEDYLEIGDDRYKIIEVKDLAPGVDDTLVYVLQVRSYRAAKDIDVLKVALSTLDLGTVVKDPYGTLFQPQWVVIGQGHHNPNTTTLMTDYVWGYRSFDGTYEGGGYFPDTPWSRSAMRYYLNNYFKTNTLSTYLQEILLNTELETAEYFYSDKVSLLSKEELFDEMVGGESSGSYMSYFASDSYRIARWYDDMVTAMEWWTRDVNEWSAPDGVICTVDDDGTTGLHNGNARAGVRPIIFLSDNTEVVLNSDGKYAIDF